MAAKKHKMHKQTQDTGFGLISLSSYSFVLFRGKNSCTSTLQLSLLTSPNLNAETIEIEVFAFIEFAGPSAIDAQP
jgi:hypothetical protein